MFFGTSLFILQRILAEIGLDTSSSADVNEPTDTRAVNSPRSPALLLTRSPKNPTLVTSKKNMQMERSKNPTTSRTTTTRRWTARFVVVDLTRVSNLDASAARGCFLQLAKLAKNKGITICACGATVRHEWMLRSHEAAYDNLEEEEVVKSRYVNNGRPRLETSERILLFLTIHEALQFCENAVVEQMSSRGQLVRDPSGSFMELSLMRERQSLSAVFSRLLGSPHSDIPILRELDGMKYHCEINYEPGEIIFEKGTEPDGFLVVLQGAAAVAISSDDPRFQSYSSKRHIVSGAGRVQQRKTSSSFVESSLEEDEVVVASLWPVGGVFGYVDFLLDRPRNFTAVATQESTVVAKMNMSQIRQLQEDSPELYQNLQRVFLRVGLLDLANCTCDE